MGSVDVKKLVQSQQHVAKIRQRRFGRLLRQETAAGGTLVVAGRPAKGQRIGPLDLAALGRRAAPGHAASKLAGPAGGQSRR